MNQQQTTFIRCFMSGHATLAYQEKLNVLLEIADIFNDKPFDMLFYNSLPPFNAKIEDCKLTQEEKATYDAIANRLANKIININTALYQPNIKNALINGVRSNELIQKVLPDLLQTKIDEFTFTQLKSVIKEVIPVLDTTEERKALFATNLQAWIELKKDNINTTQEWTQFVQTHIHPEAFNRLHQDQVLTLFGATEEECNRFKAQEYTKGDKKKQVANELRWISKTLTAYGIEGCLTDLLNLIVVLMFMPNIQASTADNPNKIINSQEDLYITDDNLISAISAFFSVVNESSDAKRHFEQNTFEVAINDCESDDLLSTLILSQIFNIKMVIFQCPNTEPFRELYIKHHNIPNISFILDPKCRNAKKININHVKAVIEYLTTKH